MADLVRLALDTGIALGVVVLVISKPDGFKRLPIAVLSTLWVLLGVIVLDELAARFGWWHFIGPWPQIGASPIDLLISWSLLWGAIPVLVLDKVRPTRIVAVFAVLDLVTMPLIDGQVVDVGRTWIVGELLGLVFVAMPALVLASLTLTRTNRSIRVSIQVVLFAAITFVLTPVLAEHLSGIPFNSPSLSVMQWSIIFHLASIPIVFALTAVIDLHRIGKGTPYPWDPTERIVSVGAYAYVKNPMQLSTSALLMMWALVAGHQPTMLAAGLAIAFSITLASFHETETLERRWGSEWASYSDQHRDWIPTMRAIVTGPTATLYIDDTCGVCSELGSFLVRRKPTGLAIASALSHPDATMRRATYVVAGYECEGIEAVARAFEHTHIGWAMISWFIRLPGILWIAQTVGDVVGFGPRPVGTGAHA